MDLTIALRYLPEFLRGLGATALLSVEVILVGTLVGIVFVPGRISDRWYMRWGSWLLINPFRILPVMVLLVWGFYSISILFGIRISAWWVSVLALGLNMGAFCAEIFRKAVEEVPYEHVEAAQLLGFPKSATWSRVILPLAFRNLSIPYLNQVLQTIKLTVLAAIISVREIYHTTSDIIQQTNKPVEMYTMLAIVLFAPLLCITLAVEWAEYRLRKGEKARKWHWIGGPT
jgi:polar amino acid transport system permease protein